MSDQIKEFWDGFKEHPGHRFDIRPTTSPSSYKIMTGFKSTYFTVRSDARVSNEHFLRCKVRFDQKKQKEFQVFFNAEIEKVNLDGEITIPKEKQITLEKSVPDLYDESRRDEYHEWLIENAELFMRIFKDHYSK